MWSVRHDAFKKCIFSIAEQFSHWRQTLFAVAESVEKRLKTRNISRWADSGPRWCTVDNLRYNCSAVTSCNDADGIPYSLYSKAYSRPVDVESMWSTCSVTVNQSLTMTPSSLRLLTRSMPEHGGSSCADLPRFPHAVKIISLDSARFNLILLDVAHYSICDISIIHDLVLAAGTTR